jgi:hypothetical protein
MVVLMGLDTVSQEVGADDEVDIHYVSHMTPRVPSRMHQNSNGSYSSTIILSTT